MRRTHAQDVLHYWMHESPHEKYLEGADRSQLLVSLVQEAWPDPHTTILEPGCNIGRNLYHLLQAGYSQLAGIEVSPRAFSFMHKVWPLLAERLVFYQGSIEDHITVFADQQFDVVVTMAVLMHLPPESEWVFEHLARVARRGLVVIEEEETHGHLRWPRKYQAIFERLGLREDLAMHCDGHSHLSANYWARRFMW